ncbi:hypothetical protein PIB30_060636 [Stylosanthes scabra]|uniref:Uncharacterized protein n=1 Tax=Stylosanthes scabra TaxID=79078 RepID=A0ABU6QKZ4_9FABA|nr:hypothetical protein [Stylosanthes scabra]
MLETLVKHESSAFCPLSALKHLRLFNVTEIEAMAEDWMKNLTSLQSLNLKGSSNVEVVLRQLEHVPSQLQKLEIGSWGGNKLELWKDKDDALPEQIGTLQSLGLVKIVGCLEVESLHEAVGCLTSLHSLWINSCPILKSKYSAETGKDRPKIAHIPNITIS